MKTFEFESPTRIYYGKDEETNVGKYIKEYGFNKVLLVYGKSSAKKSGLYDRIVSSLNENSIKYQELSGVSANPDISYVLKGLEIIRKEPVDMILAIGGGSVIDVCKLIANGYYYEGNPFDFNEHKVKPTAALKIGVVLTIPAAGSELSDSCVISDNNRKLKRGFNSKTNRPLFVIESAELIDGLPFQQLAYGITDILAHSMERYFSPSQEIEFSDYLALGLMKSVIDAGYILLKDHNNKEALKTLILASSFSHNGLTSVMKEIKMPVHQLEHELSGLHPEIAHGLGLAVLFPAWMKETYQYDTKKFALFGKVLFNIEESDELTSSLKAIPAYEDYLRLFNLPSSLKALNVSENDLKIMTQSFATRCIVGIRNLDVELAKLVYERAMKGE